MAKLKLSQHQNSRAHGLNKIHQVTTLTDENTCLTINTTAVVMIQRQAIK